MSFPVPLKGRLSAIARTAVLVCGSIWFASSVTHPAALHAQDQTLRTVEGKVVDKESAPMKGAVVYLKDGHTLAVKSYIAGDDGGFRFGQLSSNGDYTIWAENAGKKSSTRTISSFDTRNRFDVTLKIDK
jgi:hypothetical protein